MQLAWSEIPHNFGLCASDACPMAAECLHRAAAALMPAPPASPALFIYVNHYYRLRAEQEGAPCPEYLPAAPVRMALGFRRVLDEELYGMDKVKQRIIETVIQVNRTHKLPAYGLLLVGPAGTGKSQHARPERKLWTGRRKRV